ncbi:TPA: hypothetical protein ACH3X1_011532 [Trebouxia sp. C0004]
MQNALKWDQAHVIGHSMGAMVATQLASMHPDRLLSLTLISVTAGRWQSIPTNWAAIKYAWQTFWARTVEDRAKVDLKFHFMKKTLNEVDAKYKRTRRSLLHEEYVEGQKGGGMGQPESGFKGAHFVTRECGPEINLLLTHMVYHGQRIHNNPRKYLKPAADHPVSLQDKDATVEAVTLLQ